MPSLRILLFFSGHIVTSNIAREPQGSTDVGENEEKISAQKNGHGQRAIEQFFQHVYSPALQSFVFVGYKIIVFNNLSNMNINSWEILQTWIYEPENLVWDILVIWENQKVIVLLNWKKQNNINFDLLENSKLSIFWINKLDWNYSIKCTQEWNWSQLNINILNFSKENEIKLLANSKISSNNSEVKINILSICEESWNITIDSWIIIERETIWWSWIVNQENIFLWDSGRIIWIPWLDIKTSEAKASHSLKVEKISREDLFYLESRGIDKQNATHIMLASKINNLFSGIPSEYNYFYQDELDNF